jgi:flagellin
VTVARQAAETVTELLTDIKGKVVAAQEENVARDKILPDIDALRDQIGAVVGAAQFNGLNLLQNTDKTAGSDNINILASLDRSGTGVAASDITVAKQDLGSGAATAGTMATDTGNVAAVADGGTATVYAFTGTPEAGGSYAVAAGGDLNLSAAAAYVAREGDTLEDVTNAMVERLNFQAKSDGRDVTFGTTTTTGEITMTNNTGATINTVAGSSTQSAAGVTDGTVGGDLELLSRIDVTTDNGTEAALGAIEGLIQTSIDSAASFGSVQGRIETQSEFISGRTDARKSGNGTLGDADMEETSAKLQALQVQQQLGVQALSIANQAPQQLLSLFR